MARDFIEYVPRATGDEKWLRAKRFSAFFDRMVYEHIAFRHLWNPKALKGRELKSVLEKKGL